MFWYYSGWSRGGDWRRRQLPRSGRNETAISDECKYCIYLVSLHVVGGAPNCSNGVHTFISWPAHQSRSLSTIESWFPKLFPNLAFSQTKSHFSWIYMYFTVQCYSQFLEAIFGSLGGTLFCMRNQDSTVIYQTQESMFHQDIHHWEESWTYLIINQGLDIVDWRYTIHLVLNMTSSWGCHQQWPVKGLPSPWW